MVYLLYYENHRTAKARLSGRGRTTALPVVRRPTPFRAITLAAIFGLSHNRSLLYRMQTLVKNVQRYKITRIPIYSVSVPFRFRKFSSLPQSRLLFCPACTINAFPRSAGIRNICPAFASSVKPFSFASNRQDTQNASAISRKLCPLFTR